MNHFVLSDILSFCDIDDLPKLMLVNEQFENACVGIHSTNVQVLSYLDLSVQRFRPLPKVIGCLSVNPKGASRRSMQSWKLLAIYTQKLSVKGRRDFILEEFVKFLKNSLQLKELNMKGCYLVNDSLDGGVNDSMDIVIDALPNRIVSLKIDQRISVSAVETLLICHKNLEELKLNAESLVDEDFEDIVRCKKLKKLCVSSCERLTNRFLGYMKCLENLTCLRLLGGVEFTQRGLASLFECQSYLHLIECRCLQQLVELDLSDSTEFDDYCVDQMIKCCGETLEILRVSSSVAITDVGYKSIENKCCKKVVIT